MGIGSAVACFFFFFFFFFFFCSVCHIDMLLTLARKCQIYLKQIGPYCIQVGVLKGKCHGWAIHERQTSVTEGQMFCNAFTCLYY